MSRPSAALLLSVLCPALAAACPGMDLLVDDQTWTSYWNPTSQAVVAWLLAAGALAWGHLQRDLVGRRPWGRATFVFSTVAIWVLGIGSHLQRRFYFGRHGIDDLPLAVGLAAAFSLPVLLMGTVAKVRHVVATIHQHPRGSEALAAAAGPKKRALDGGGAEEAATSAGVDWTDLAVTGMGGTAVCLATWAVWYLAILPVARAL